MRDAWSLMMVVSDSFSHHLLIDSKHRVMPGRTDGEIAFEIQHVILAVNERSNYGEKFKQLLFLVDLSRNAIC